MGKNIAADAARMDMLSASIKAMQEELADLKAEYADLPDDKYDAGDYVMTVLRKRMFQPALAKANLTKAEYESILVPKPDPARAKVLLDPKRYERAVSLSAPVITLKRVTDAEN